MPTLPPPRAVLSAEDRAALQRTAKLLDPDGTCRHCAQAIYDLLERDTTDQAWNTYDLVRLQLEAMRDPNVRLLDLEPMDAPMVRLPLAWLDDLLALCRQWQSHECD